MKKAAAPVRVEPWNRLDPGTQALNDREAHALYLEGAIAPRLRVALKVLLTEILVLPKEP